MKQQGWIIDLTLLGHSGNRGVGILPMDCQRCVPPSKLAITRKRVFTFSHKIMGWMPTEHFSR